jgi:hypothetical protein
LHIVYITLKRKANDAHQPGRSVSIVITLRTGRKWNRVFIPGTDKRYLFPKYPHWFWGIGCVHESEKLPLFNVESKKA